MKAQGHKDECRGGARQVAKTVSKFATDFIATTARFASADNGCNILFLVLVLQFVALVWVAL